MTGPAIPAAPQPTAMARRLAIVWWGVALGIVIGCGLNAISGFDWVHFYYPRAHDFAPETVINPLWLYLLIAPLGYLPMRVSYALFSLVNVSLLWLGSRLTGVNRFALLLSFPALWVLWYGQVDILVMFGAALGFWAVQTRRPIWLGVALLLLLIKPHIGAPLAILYFLWLRDWRALAVCGAVLFLTLIIWGFDWPLSWLRSLLQVAAPPPDVALTTAGQQTNISLFPYGLLAWLVMLLPMSRVERAIGTLAATFLSAPYAATYSLITLLVLPAPWWVYLLSSVPLVLGPKGYWLTTFAPLGCLGWLAARRLTPFVKARLAF